MKSQIGDVAPMKNTTGCKKTQHNSYQRRLIPKESEIN
jgi:hypothetical protein